MILHDPRSYRNAVQTALADGARFAGLHATANGTIVRAALTDPDGNTQLVSARSANGVVPTIVDLAPAAGWDEREAHDLYGTRFEGHEPLRPLVNHDPVLAHWTTPVHGEDAYQVAVGPIHAGVIESGHFRFHVVGERILHLDARLFYKHRGLERAAEGHTPDRALPFVGRACAACAVSNTLAYSQACEEALGLTPTPELARTRTILLELERAWNHLNDIAAVCAGIGFAAGNNHFAALTERARRLNAQLTGHRFLFATVQIGASNLAIDRPEAQVARRELARIHTDARTGSRELLFNSSVQDRLPDIGVVAKDDATRLGTVGPAARAAGLPLDARTATGAHLTYPGFTPVTPQPATGDVRARLEQRTLELTQTLEILDTLLNGHVKPAVARTGGPIHPIGIGIVESPRGATNCIIERNGDHLTRLRLRTGSYANWPTVAFAATANLLPDFPLINKSFELCYACADR